MFLALLLVRGFPPVIQDCSLEEVHLQTAHRGWQTDDVLVIGSRGMTKRKLAAQVKLGLTISDSDEDCRRVFSGFWNDFHRGDLFDRERDCLLLVTQRDTEALRALRLLLDAARAATDHDDFFHRSSQSGFLSKVAQGQRNTLWSIIRQSQGSEPDRADFWAFLRALHVATFDLNSSTAQAEANIKSLLASASNETDGLAAAEATWQELLQIAGRGMPIAASYNLSHLPQAMRDRFRPIPTWFDDAIAALVAHSNTVLDTIRDTIAGAVKIRRDPLEERVWESLGEFQAVLVTGPAGSGKSALAKGAVGLLRNDHFCLAFRAEEFAEAHLDHTLKRIHSTLSSNRLLGLLAAQGKKVVLIESLERLLEASVRDSLSDLVHLVKRDRSFQLVLTCRDYSAETVRSSFLEANGLKYKVLPTPLLTDHELEQAAQSVPVLSRPLSHQNLKELLRLPYLLDKASRMDWSAALPVPADERAFRMKCWNEVIRRDSYTRDGLPHRREAAFQEIALRRARALTQYVLSDDLDGGAIEELRKDNLLSTSPDSSALVAPGHDVLEDWAIIRWITGLFGSTAADPQVLANSIGGLPALRRAHRKWLAELLECEPERGDSLVLSALTDRTLPPYFRDDTLICALNSSSAGQFLLRHKAELLAEGASLLTRIIHLVRVGCKASPDWLSGLDKALPSSVLVPSGTAWPTVLAIIADNIDALLPANLGLLLGLVEDWCRGINWMTPTPPGFESSGKIAFALLDRLEGYANEEVRGRVLSVLLKIPRAEPVQFLDLMKRGVKRDRQDLAAEELADALLSGLEAFAACRDFPAEVVELAMRRLCLTEAEVSHEYSWHHDIEPYFGIRDHTNSGFFPPSAIRGPFYYLLRSHPEIGLKFILDLLNHAGVWYGERRWPYDPLEPAWLVKIRLPGGETVDQWANPRLWCLYRGLSVAPYVLQCAAMALEKWLLEACQSSERDVEGDLLRVLRGSNNVAATAVVAGVCNACPDKAGRAGIAILSHPDLFDMDRARMVQDRGSSVSDLMPSIGAEGKLYDEERKQAGALPHRKHDLEALAINLQLRGGKVRDDVWGILDQYRAALPPLKKQSDRDRLWRLALHRMDIRGYRATTEVTPESDESTPKSTKRVVYVLGEIEEDLKEIVKNHEPVQARQQRLLALLAWGRSAWDGESKNIDPGQWRDRLAESRRGEVEDAEAEDFLRGGPGMVAAVCVRDHWDEMGADERAWCVSSLLREVSRDANSSDDMVRHARMVQPDRAAAFVLPLVLAKTSPSRPDRRVKVGIIVALTHSVDQVTAYAAEGVGRFLKGEWLDFAEHCAGALARRATEASGAGTSRGARARRDPRSRVALTTRQFFPPGLNVDQELEKLQFTDWPGRFALRPVLQILGQNPESPRARAFYTRVSNAIAESWVRRDRGEGRDVEFEHDAVQRIARFALMIEAREAISLCKPVIDTGISHPHELSHFLRSSIYEADTYSGQTPFWSIWGAIADGFCGTRYSQELDERHSQGVELLNLLFLGVEWKEGVRHWRRLDEEAGLVDALAGRLTPSSAVFTAYCRFLSEVGAKSLPDAFAGMAELFDRGKGKNLFSNRNAMWYAEKLLRRYVYGQPHALKANPKIRAAILRILDEMVEAGSSSAFRMRDDFVTPIVL